MTTKGMSPLRTLTQSSPRKPQYQDGSSNENALDQQGAVSASSVPCRAPLCPIPLPSQLGEGIGNDGLTSKGKLQASTPRGKSKLQQRSGNPGGTPEKHTGTGLSALGRNRFGWHQPRFQAIGGTEKEPNSAGFSSFSPIGKHGQESPRSNEGKDIRTPSKLLRSSSCSEASHGSDGIGAHEGQMNSNCVQPTLGRAGNSNQSTPISTKGLRSATNDPGNSGGSQLTGTPNRNVSRTLKYTTSNGPSSSGASGTRSGLPGLRLTGPLSQPARSAQTHSSDYQSIESHFFELEEDPLFWNDHNVQVLIRCRPLNSAEIASQGYSRCLRQETAHTVTWIGQPESRFTFDHVACEKITQEKLFKVAGIPMVDNCMSGYNSCMFAYGQTGSGKTHTMLGDIGELEQRPSDNRGMTPRIFEYLFGQISMEEEMRKNERLKFTCKCSFLEIYNEQITDLLEPSSTNLQMREDLKKGVYVENLSEVEVTSVQDVVFLLLQGAANRRVAATNMNQESSRSHSVFTCVIESKWESESMTNLRFGRLNLVDLAGSERQKSSGAEGERLKEAANINKSLSTLGLVIMILVDVAQGKQRHVPYRDSKLTFLLQDSLGGNSKTTIIANVSSSVSCASETLSTLKFAQRAKFIRNNAIVNEDASGDVLALRLQIQQLKDELNRLSRQSISRIPFSSGMGLLEFSAQDVSNGGSAVVGYSSKSVEKGDSYEAALKKVKALEVVVVGSLRREQAADNTAKRLTGEIEQLNCLVRQREDDAQFNKMMLRFREDKIRRLEATIDGAFSEESYRSEDKHALREELDLMRGRLDKNPELTRFAMENIRLREQLQRLQDFYEGGERDILLEEISGLRDQLSEYLEAKLLGDDNELHGKMVEAKEPNEILLSSSTCEEGNTISKLESLLQEKEDRIQWEVYRADELNRQLDDARHTIGILEFELKKNKDTAIELTDRLQFTEASLAAAQETAASAQATVKQIRLETEDIALQQRQSFSEIQEATTAWRLQELQLRAQLEEAQNMIEELSIHKNPASLEQSNENEPKPGTAETVMQLQLELDAMDCLIQEERSYRKDSEEKSIFLSMQLDESEERNKGLRAQVNEVESRIERLSIQFDEAEEKELEMSKRLLESVEDLNHHKLVVESLENQALISMQEISDLQTQNIRLTEGLKTREDELKVLTGCVVFLQSELQRELEIRVLELEATDNHDSNLKEKLERTRKALEQAEQLNSKLQNEQKSLKALEHERELVRADAEMETTEAITVLQSELINLCEDHKMTQERELKAEQKIMRLKMEARELQAQVKELSEKNALLNSLYQNALKEKDAEISKLTQDWEMAASNLIECLSEGNQALDDATQEIDKISEECPGQNNLDMNLESFAQFKEKNIVEVLERRLLHAQKLAKQTEDKVRILSDASLSIADMQRQERTSMQNELEALNLLLAEKFNHINCLHTEVENWKGRAQKGETKFLALCIVINKLSETGSELATTNQRVQHLVEKSAWSMVEKDAEIHCLQLQRKADQAILDEKETALLNNEQLIQNLHKQMQDVTCQNKIVEDNYSSLKSKEDTTTAKFKMAEKQVQELTLQVVKTEETCARLLDELHLANVYIADNVVRVVEIQLLEDLLSFQENLVQEKLLQSRSMFYEVEAHYLASTKELHDRIFLLEAKNENLLDELMNERNLTLQLRKDVQNNMDKLSTDYTKLEMEYSAEQERLLGQIGQLQNSCLKVGVLESQNAYLVEELTRGNSYAAQLEAEVVKIQSESFARLQAVMETWAKDKIAAIVNAELLECQVCLMEEDHLLCEPRLEAVKKYCHDQVTSLEKDSMASTQRITETDVLVQELRDKLQTSALHLHMSQLEATQAKQNGSYLSMHVENLSEELAADNFANTVQMDIIKHVLNDQIQYLQECRLKLMVEMMETKKTSAELAWDKSLSIAKMEALMSEVAILKIKTVAAQEASGSLAEELSQSNDHLQLLQIQAEEAQVRCDHLVSHSTSIQEKFSLDIYVLVLEEAILKEMLVSQEGIVEYEAIAFNSKFHVLQEEMQEYLEKVDCLKSQNAGLVEQVKSLLEAAQSCVMKSKSLKAELTNYREHKTEDAHIARDGLLAYNSQATEHDGEPGSIYFKDRENRLSIEQRIEQTYKAFLLMKEDLGNCRHEVHILNKERDHLLENKNQEEHLHAALDMELENIHCNFEKIKLDCMEVNECVVHSIGLSQNSAEYLTEARSIVTQLRKEYGLLLEKIGQKECETLILQYELQQTCESLRSLEKMHSSCESNLQQILEHERKQNKEELVNKGLSECQLQSQLCHVSEWAKTLDQMYKDASNQLESKSLEVEQLHQQQQDDSKLISGLQQENAFLQEELTTMMKKMQHTTMLYESGPTDASHSVTRSQLKEVIGSPKDALFDVGKLELLNQELKAEVERQRGDMECLQHELKKSCDIVSEVKSAHSKTIDMLREREQQLSKVTAEVKANRASILGLEQDNAVLQKQNAVLLKENKKSAVQQQILEKDLHSFSIVQERIVKSVETVENQETKLLALGCDLDCLLASNLLEERNIDLIGVFEDCQLMLENIETLVYFCSKVSKDLETSQAYSKHMESALEKQETQMKSMYEKIVDLERDKEHLQDEQSRREAAMKILQLRSQERENVQDVLKATHEGSEKLLEVVEGNEMKLTGLQRKIQRMTEWLSQEIGNDFKVAFTEGCELVLNEVENEVQTCREQAEIAWKKVDTVLDEKRGIEENLLERDQMIKRLQIELAVLQGHSGAAEKEISEMQKLSMTIKQLQGNLDERQLYVDKLENEFSQLQQSFTLAEMEEILSEQKERLSSMEIDNVQLRSQLQELIARKEFDEVNLENKQHAIQVLEMELLNLNSLEQEKAFHLDRINHDLDNAVKERDLAIKERDELHADLVVLNEQLDMAQQHAEEHEAIAVEARQIAEASKTRAEQKEEEAKLLERSVEELESTVNALETQVGLIKSDTERQRLMREDTEMELQALRHQMSHMQARQADSEVQRCDWEHIKRDLEMKGAQLIQAEEKVEILEQQCDEKEEQIRKYKNDIMEIISEAERQASDHHQIIRTLENMAEQRPIVQVPTSSKLADRATVKPRGSGSPFKCIGSGLSHQMSFEIDEELCSNRQKIEELEALANSRQKEIFMLNVRLAEAESMTHDVIRDLVGVKLDITNYATFINHQQVQKIAAKSVLQNEQAREKDKELAQLKNQLNEFIEERESWLEEINRRQAEMMTARVAAEKLRQRDQLLSTENETLKMENASQRKRLIELEDEINKLSGQQNLQQRIHHHAKIKEENNNLRMKNEDLATKLRRSEALLNRVGEELARYREADGKSPYVDIEEEQKLRVKLQEVEEEKIQIAQELLTLCTSVLQVAGLTSTRGIDHTVAAEALKHLQDRLDTTEREISDMRLKNKIDSEKWRLSELRSLHSPGTATNFAAMQECRSPYS